jgi:hypothetical protein
MNAQTQTVHPLAFFFVIFVLGFFVELGVLTAKALVGA